jgi:hypothetical protein
LAFLEISGAFISLIAVALSEKITVAFTWGKEISEANWRKWITCFEALAAAMYSPEKGQVAISSRDLEGSTIIVVA